MAPNESAFPWKTGVEIKNLRYKSVFERKSQVFEESIKERGSMYEHFPLCGSAWGAIWGRLSKKKFYRKSVFRKFDVSGILLEGGVGRFLKNNVYV